MKRKDMIDLTKRIGFIMGSLRKESFSKVVADKFENCIIVDESFDISKDFHIFVIEYLDLTQKGNVVENLAKFICNLIKK